MDKNTVITAINFFEKCLTDKGINISKIILFGSYANGTPDHESDIDLVIISNDFDGKNIFERANLTKEAEILTIKKYLIPLDIITLSDKEFESQSINGEIIYDNTKKAA
jgi:predicted nucleotidyltransferase